VSPHDVPSQVVTPAAEVGQAVHDVPQLPTAVFEAQTPEQRWNVDLQSQPCVVMLHVSFVEHCVSKAQPGLH
jgi:hypothetical protein